ncbi:amidohydrolase, partial [Flavobacteriaceae bacterium]|nr:amidohydrolase [Flavobacteriaceae bacterium]
ENITPEKNEALKTLAIQWVQDNEKLSQVMVDKIFSFSELGFQEEASSKYLTDLLKKRGLQ